MDAPSSSTRGAECSRDILGMAVSECDLFADLEAALAAIPPEIGCSGAPVDPSAYTNVKQPLRTRKRQETAPSRGKAKSRKPMGSLENIGGHQPTVPTTKVKKNPASDVEAVCIKLVAHWFEHHSQRRSVDRNVMSSADTIISAVDREIVTHLAVRKLRELRQPAVVATVAKIVASVIAAFMY